MMARLDAYCPICGRVIKDEHRCPESTLRAIDAANTRALREEDAETGAEPFWRGEFADVPIEDEDERTDPYR